MLITINASVVMRFCHPVAASHHKPAVQGARPGISQATYPRARGVFTGTRLTRAVARESLPEQNGYKVKAVTDRISLLGSISLMVNSPMPETGLSEPVFMETETKEITLKYDSDEQRWSQLMANAQSGNESDYRQLLTELTDVIYNFLCSRFGHYHFTEDCVQETLIAIHQARHTYDQRRSFRPWLFAIVRNKAIDTLRKQRSRQKLSSQYKGEQEILTQTSQQNEAESDIIRSRLLDSLSAEHRDVLVLTKIIGFSIAETSEKLGISESLVKVRVHRAIRKLRQEMEADRL